MNQRASWFSAGQIPCEPLKPLHDRPFRLVLLGPPGVGKGTQAQLLSEQLHACHLSTGDLFRSMACEGSSSPALKEAQAAMRRGELVSDELVIEMVRERSDCLHCRGGFMLDGFPRTVGQAEALKEMLTELKVTLDAVICYDLPLDSIVSRLSGRQTCEACGAVFHLSKQPSQVADECDLCQGHLVQRDDDRPESIRVRMQTYEDATQPILDYYERKGLLKRVEAVGHPEEILDRTLRLLDFQGTTTPER